MRATYEDHVARSESEYVRSFDEWIGKLTDRQLEELSRTGVLGVEKKKHENGEIEKRYVGAHLEDAPTSGMGLNHDAAELPAASYDPDLKNQVGKLADEFVEKFELPQEVALPLAAWAIREIETRSLQYKSRLMGRVCGVFIDGKNPKLFAAGLAFAANLNAMNVLGTQRLYARKIHVTPAALSKVVKMWQIALEMPISAHMKQESSCKAYAAVQSSDQHWRRQKATAKKLMHLTNGNGNGKHKS